MQYERSLSSAIPAAYPRNGYIQFNKNDTVQLLPRALNLYQYAFFKASCS